jgi:hypothetical protein
MDAEIISFDAEAICLDDKIICLDDKTFVWMIKHLFG